MLTAVCISDDSVMFPHYQTLSHVEQWWWCAKNIADQVIKYKQYMYTVSQNNILKIYTPWSQIKSSENKCLVLKKLNVMVSNCLYMYITTWPNSMTHEVSDKQQPQNFLYMATILTFPAFHLWSLALISTEKKNTHRKFTFSLFFFL